MEFDSVRAKRPYSHQNSTGPTFNCSLTRSPDAKKVCVNDIGCISYQTQNLRITPAQGVTICLRCAAGEPAHLTHILGNIPSRNPTFSQL